jgi:16S rRNA (guanine966-N2)-methyltransferase
MTLRVIAGSAGGRRLVAPKGGARPTTDRVKEALFASLGSARVEGAHVLDLYAGSGALAIEALSRGAARAVLVDHASDAIAAIRANLETVGFSDAARSHRAAVATFLGGPASSDAPFDLVLLDPPYDLAGADVEAALVALADGRWLAPDATVVIERPKAGEPLTLPDGWAPERERGYGDTRLLIVHVEGAG